VRSSVVKFCEVVVKSSQVGSCLVAVRFWLCIVALCIVQSGLVAVCR